MALFKIIFKPSVAKDLKRLDRSTVTRILTAIEALGKDPFSNSSKKLVGSDHTYRVRIGNYRVIYIANKICERLKSSEYDTEKMFISSVCNYSNSPGR